MSSLLKSALSFCRGWWRQKPSRTRWGCCWRCWCHQSVRSNSSNTQTAANLPDISCCLKNAADVTANLSLVSRVQIMWENVGWCCSYSTETIWLYLSPPLKAQVIWQKPIQAHCWLLELSNDKWIIQNETSVFLKTIHTFTCDLWPFLDYIWFSQLRECSHLWTGESRCESFLGLWGSWKVSVGLCSLTGSVQTGFT